MHMKKITFLLMVFAFAWNTPVKADVFPEASKDGKVKWYFLQSIRPEETEWLYWTAVEDDEVWGMPEADYSDYESLAKQLWSFVTEDGEWYTIYNRYDGRKLGVGMGSQGECIMLMDEMQAKFKIRALEDGIALESSIPAPGGGEIFRWPSLAGSGSSHSIWLVRESNADRSESKIILTEYTDAYVPQNNETVTWYNITTAEDGADGEIITDNTSVVDAQYKFTVEKKDPSDQNAQWRFVETEPGNVSIVNRATGNSISTTLTAQDRYTVPTADDKSVVATCWNLLPVSETQYAIASVGSDNIQRMLNAQVLGNDPNAFPEDLLSGTSYAWTFSQADTEVGIENTVTQQEGNVRVENGRIIAPEGAKVNVFTPEGVEMPADSKLMPGIYIVTVNGKATKILVH